MRLLRALAAGRPGSLCGLRHDERIGRALMGVTFSILAVLIDEDAPAPDRQLELTQVRVPGEVPVIHWPDAPSAERTINSQMGSYIAKALRDESEKYRDSLRVSMEAQYMGDHAAIPDYVVMKSVCNVCKKQFPLEPGVSCPDCGKELSCGSVSG